MSAYMDPAAGYGGALGRTEINARRKPKPKPQPKTPPRRAMTMEEWAEQQAEKRIQAEVDAIREQQRIFEQERMANYQRKLEQAKGLAEMMQRMGFDKAIQGVYSNAANDLSGMAGSFAGETREIAAADAAAQRNMLSGTGQEGAVRDQGTNMGDVLYGVGGWIPGKALGEQGAAYAANAALQPAFTLQQGAVEAQRAFDEEGSALSDFSLAIAEAKAGKFTLKEELMEERRSAALAQQKLNIQRFENDREFWLKKQALAIQRADNASTIAERKEQLRLAALAEKRAAAADKAAVMESQGLAPDGSLLPGFWRDAKTGRVYSDKYIRKGNSIVERSEANRKKPPSQEQRRIQIEAVMEKRDDIEGEIAKAVRVGEWDPTPASRRDERGGVIPPPAYYKRQRSKLAKRLFDMYAHLVTNNPTAKKRLRNMINTLLIEAEKGGSSAAGSSTGAGGLLEGIPKPGAG